MTFCTSYWNSLFSAVAFVNQSSPRKAMFWFNRQRMSWRGQRVPWCHWDKWKAICFKGGPAVIYSRQQLLIGQHELSTSPINVSGWNASVQPHCQLYGPRNLCYRKHNSFLSPLVLAAKLSPWSISSLDDPSEACYFLCCLRSDVCALVVLRAGGLWQREIYGRGLCNSFRVCKQRSGIATDWSFLQVACVHACVFVCQCYCLLSLSKKLP